MLHTEWNFSMQDLITEVWRSVKIASSVMKSVFVSSIKLDTCGGKLRSVYAVT